MNQLLKDILGYGGIILLFLSPIIAIIFEEWSKIKASIGGSKNEDNTNEKQSVN